MSLTIEATTIHTEVPFGDSTIMLYSGANGETFDISPDLRDPSDFHGDPNVHHLVDFGDALKGIIGTFEEPQKLVELGNSLIVLEDTNPEAAQIVQDISRLALQVIGDKKLYDNIPFCGRYYDLAEKGYRLLRQDIPPQNIDFIVSLLRGGAVASRLDLGLDKNATISNEFLVETKRAHPKDGRQEDLMVTVRFPEGYDPHDLHEKDIAIPDFVNPASWSSTAAFLIALKEYGVIPRSVEHRSFMGTAQGVVLAARFCKQIGIENVLFRMVGMSRKVDANYYLKGDKVVADAGHALRHFLPSWLS
jgi:hypothetical protein